MTRELVERARGGDREVFESPAAAVIGNLFNIAQPRTPAPRSGRTVSSVRTRASTLVVALSALAISACSASPPAPSIAPSQVSAQPSSTIAPTPTASPALTPGVGTSSEDTLGVSVPADTAAATMLHVPVLMYHRVMPPSLLKVDERWPDLYVDPVTFDAQIAAMKSRGWHTVTTGQLAAAVMARRSLPSHSVVITFDDGRPDNYTYAFPILKKYGFVATFFIVSGRIGRTSHITASQLQEMAAAGNELADHTWDHTDLTTLTYAQARFRIRAAADAIESLVGVRPTTLAYPYGHYDSTVLAAADAEGMYLAFTVHAGAWESAATRLFQPRLRVQGLVRQADGSYSGGTTAQQLLARLAPYAD